MRDPLYEEGSRPLLPPDAFSSVLDGEFKRAVRSQSFLTLVTIEATREWAGLMVAADDGTVHEVARLVAGEVRDTDLLGQTECGTLGLVLVDVDLEHASVVIDRVVSRVEHYGFPNTLRIVVGAACYPTHAVDGSSLKRQAMSHPIVHWRHQFHAADQTDRSIRLQE
jgi:hypothetical protein